MTGTELTTYIRYLTKTNTNSLTNAELLPIVNMIKNELAMLAAERNNTLFLIPATDSLVASQREYAWPSDVLNHIHTIEVAFSQTSPVPYILAKAITRQEYTRSLTEANVSEDFGNGEGEVRYFRRRRAIYILSGAIDSTTLGGATVASGLRVVYRAYPADLANLTGSTALETDPSTTTFGMPLQLHELWGRRCSIIYKSSRPKPVPLSSLELNYEVDLEKALRALSHEDIGAEIITGLPADKNGQDL